MALIYFVEDDDNIRKLVCYALGREGHEIKGFALPSEFRAAYRETPPQLALLDIMLPEESGLSLLKSIRSSSRIPVIMLTAKGGEFDKVTGLDMGADDYISKPFGMTELASRIRAVLRRCGGSEDNVYRLGELFVDCERREARVRGEEISLAFKEFELLRILLKAQGKAVKREELLTEIWGEFYGESRTLDVHIRNLRVKLKSAGNYIKTVKNIGYKIEEAQ